MSKKRNNAFTTFYIYKRQCFFFISFTDIWKPLMAFMTFVKNILFEIFNI